MSLLTLFGGKKKTQTATKVAETPYVSKNSPPPGFIRLSKPEGVDDKDLCGDYTGWLTPADPDCTTCFGGGYMKVEDIEVCHCRRADDKVRASTAAAAAAANSHSLSMSKGNKS